MSSKIKSFSYLTLSIILTQLIQIRPYFSKKFYGDPFDGRLQIVLHEHWWRLIRGETSLRNTDFFYPFDKALGFSDPFIIQGLIHSFFRFMRFDMYESWALSICVMFLIGNIGLSLIAYRLIKNHILQFGFVLLSGISYTFITHVQIHPNITGMALIPYLLYFLIDYQKNPTKTFSALSVLFPLLMLTSWYGAFFLLLFILILLMIRKSIIFEISFFLKELSSNLIRLIPFIILSISLFLLFIYIHLPALSANDRTSQELILNSPNFSNIFNGAQQGGGIFSEIYDFLGYKGEQFPLEYQVGLTLSSIFILIYVGLNLALYLKRFIEYKLLSIIFLVNIAILIIFFEINGTSLFSYLYESSKIFGSIRVPIRYVIIFYTINLFIFFKILDINFRLKNKSNLKYVFYLLVILLFLDQIRFTTSGFTKSDYKGDSNLSNILQSKPECKSFILSTESFEWWDDQLQAMITSAETGIPTVNGYSGGFPENYPNLDWRSKSDLLRVGKWLETNGATDTVCVLRRNLVENFETKVFVDSDEGFDLLESDGKNIWRWSIEKNAALKVINYRNIAASGVLIFEVMLPSCATSALLDIQFGNVNKQISLVSNVKNNLIKLDYLLEPETQQLLNFSIDSLGCKLASDSRNLFFNISNIKIL